jgi:phospholipid/cholesterol/gamma-HCH transport system ATP-binding protein
MNNSDPIIRVEEVSKAFSGHPVLRGITLDIEPGKTTVIIGPSGCGKTVLLKHMIGLIRPDRGRVYFRGQEISSMDEHALVPIRRRMGFLFQGGALFDSMTVTQNVIFPMEEHGLGDAEERIRRSHEVLAMVGLDDFGDRLPEKLSGGQQKRVALARAIVLNPEVIFYDEPTTGLDPIRADLINELILKLQQVLGNTAVVVTHDMTSARKVGDRIVMLDHGGFIADTTPDKLDDIDDEVVTRFVRGQASPDELAKLRENGQPYSTDAKSERTIR